MKNDFLPEPEAWLWLAALADGCQEYMRSVCQSLCVAVNMMYVDDVIPSDQIADPAAAALIPDRDCAACGRPPHNDREAK